MIKNCQISGAKFKIYEKDIDYYKKFDVPIPEICPDERARLRMMFSNQRHLFFRNCDYSNKKVISNFAPSVKFRVYDLSFWWTDSWNQHQNQMEYNPNRSFFEQFQELFNSAVLPSMNRGYEFDENSDYTNHSGNNKDCYFIFDANECRNVYYSYSVNNCKDSMDLFRATKCELCYELVDCSNCYNSAFLQNSYNCSDSYFLKNCIGCNNCFFSVNLKNKEYYFYNKKYSKEDYFKKIAEINLKSRKVIKKLRLEFAQYILKFPFRAVEGFNNENCIGSYISDSKNAFYAFDSRNMEDCRYVQQIYGDTKDSIDCTEIGIGANLCYESHNGGWNVYYQRFCGNCFCNANFLTYCYYTPHSTNCFGCIGLHHKKFCILNKQYSEKEYYDLEKQIISDMKKSGEWGKNFPASISPFEYNITHAFDFYPLTKEEALARGYKWRDNDSEEYFGSKLELPDENSDSLINKILSCKNTGKNFIITKAEFKLMEKLNLPFSDLCFETRHLNRAKMRNPAKIKFIEKDGKKIYTTVNQDVEIQSIEDFLISLD